MKTTPLLIIFIPILLVAAVGTLAPGLLSGLTSSYGIDDRQGVAGVSLIAFIASCLAIGVGILLLRFGRRPAISVAAGVVCFLLTTALWPVSVSISKRADEEGNVDSGTFVYRAIWKGPYPHIERDDIQINEIDRFEQSSGWLGKTELYILVDASEGAAYGWENIPQYPNSTWSESDIAEVRGHGGIYSCLNRRERTYGPFTNIELVTPTYHPAAFRRLCAPK
jgi:hypothetical protein